MDYCKPAKKEHNPNPKTDHNWVRTITCHPCFRCLRNVEQTNKYDFVSECAADVMIKMDSEELEALSQEVLQVVLEVDTQTIAWEEAILLGDCLARVFMFTLTRDHYLREMIPKHENVRRIIYIAAEKSMPAYGVASLYDKDITVPMCWLDMTES